MNSLLRMEDITKIYPGVVANDRISLEVVEGEIHALLGENGAGKTTLMRILYGMSSPDSGTLYWRGEPVEISTTQEAIRLGIGMVHQHFMLIPEFTVVENVVLGLHTARSPLLDLAEAAKRLQEFSERFGLRVEPGALVRDLSTGEQQRIEIVKALYRGAHLLVLDEPTANLDPYSSRELLELVARLNEEKGMTVVLVEHRLDLVLRHATRLVVMDEGTILLDGAPREVVLDPRAKIVGVPKVVEVYEGLERKGIKLNKVPLTPSELARAVESAVVARGRARDRG